MKTVGCFLFFFGMLFNAYSQDYDLIATDKGESIACIIDSVAEAAIYFKMKFNNKWVHTSIDRDQVVEYKFNAIDKNAIILKPGTSYINLAYDEQDAYLMKAQSLQKSGKIVTITGASILGITIISEIACHEQWGLGAIVIGLIGGSAGLATIVTGIAINGAGKNRVARLTSNMNTSHNGITFDLKPCVQYSPMAQNYQPGVVFRIRF